MAKQRSLQDELATRILTVSEQMEEELFLAFGQLSSEQKACYLERNDALRTALYAGGADHSGAGGSPAPPPAAVLTSASCTGWEADSLLGRQGALQDSLAKKYQTLAKLQEQLKEQSARLQACAESLKKTSCLIPATNPIAKDPNQARLFAMTPEQRKREGLPVVLKGSEAFCECAVDWTHAGPNNTSVAGATTALVRSPGMNLLDADHEAIHGRSMLEEQACSRAAANWQSDCSVSFPCDPQNGAGTATREQCADYLYVHNQASCKSVPQRTATGCRCRTIQVDTAAGTEVYLGTAGEIRLAPGVRSDALNAQAQPDRGLLIPFSQFERELRCEVPWHVTGRTQGSTTYSLLRRRTSKAFVRFRETPLTLVKKKACEAIESRWREHCTQATRVFTRQSPPAEWMCGPEAAGECTCRATSPNAEAMRYYEFKEQAEDPAYTWILKSPEEVDRVWRAPSPSGDDPETKKMQMKKKQIVEYQAIVDERDSLQRQIFLAGLERRKKETREYIEAIVLKMLSFQKLIALVVTQIRQIDPDYVPPFLINAWNSRVVGRHDEIDNIPRGEAGAARVAELTCKIIRCFAGDPEAEAKPPGTDKPPNVTESLLQQAKPPTSLKLVDGVQLPIKGLTDPHVQEVSEFLDRVKEFIEASGNVYLRLEEDYVRIVGNGNEFRNLTLTEKNPLENELEALLTIQYKVNQYKKISADPAKWELALERARIVPVEEVEVDLQGPQFAPEEEVIGDNNIREQVVRALQNKNTNSQGNPQPQPAPKTAGQRPPGAPPIVGP